MVVGAPTMENKIIQRWIIGSALMATILFGLFRQFKVMFQSIDSMRTSQLEAGEDARFFKNRLEQRIGSQKTNHAVIVYITDRTDAEGRKPGVEFYYDAQYGFAPFILKNGHAEGADYYLLDFASERALSNYLETRGFVIFEKRGLMVLATKS